MEQIKVHRVHSHTPDTPPDGWCVVFRGRTVEAGPFKDKSEASMKLSSLVDYNHIFNYGNLQLRFGTKETDGSDDFIPGVTPATDSTVTVKKVNMNKMKLRDFISGAQPQPSTRTTEAKIEEASAVDAYTSLNDAAKFEPVLAKGDDLSIWYMKDESFRDFSGGYKWLEKKGMLPQTPADLRKTHEKLGSIKSSDLEDVFTALQGENWSPNGEARILIKALGLSHTSMSVGDIILVDGIKMMLVDSFGFREIKTEVKESDGANSVKMSIEDIMKNFDHAVGYDAAAHKPAMMRRRGNDGKLYDLVKTEDDEYTVTLVSESLESNGSEILNEWIPDKESLVYFEKLAKQQKRIWSDSIDVGVLVDDAKKKEAREHLMTLMDTYGSKLTKWETGSTTKVFIPIEHDEGGLAGTLLEVSYNEIKTRGSLLDKSNPAKGFLSIELSHKVLSSKEAKEKYGARMVDESLESDVVGPF